MTTCFSGRCTLFLSEYISANCHLYTVSQRGMSDDNVSTSTWLHHICWLTPNHNSPKPHWGSPVFYPKLASSHTNTALWGYALKNDCDTSRFISALLVFRAQCLDLFKFQQFLKSCNIAHFPCFSLVQARKSHFFQYCTSGKPASWALKCWSA